MKESDYLITYQNVYKYNNTIILIVLFTILFIIYLLVIIKKYLKK